MSESCLLYYITDRSAFSGDGRTRRRRLLDKIAEAASCGVNYVQLREKDLPTRELESLAREAMCIIREQNKPAPGTRGPATAFLINSRTDVALATGADGVHLRGKDVSVEDVRKAWNLADSRGAGTLAREIRKTPLVGVSCHFVEDVFRAAAAGASFAVFAPVFEKKDVPRATPTGLEALQQACSANIPVFALGGVTLANAASCLQAGAAGIAAIRLFQENDIAEIARELRNLR